LKSYLYTDKETNESRKITEEQAIKIICNANFEYSHFEKCKVAFKAIGEVDTEFFKISKMNKISVKFLTEYNSLHIFKCVENNRYYCQYYNDKDFNHVMTASKYEGWKYEADCTLKEEYSLELVEPFYVIARGNRINESFKTKKEAKERLPDYKVYEWFNELEIKEITKIENQHQDKEIKKLNEIAMEQHLKNWIKN